MKTDGGYFDPRDDPRNWTPERIARHDRRWRLLHPPPVRWVTNLLFRTFGASVSTVWSDFWWMWVVLIVIVVIALLGG